MTNLGPVIADWETRIEAALWDEERTGSLDAAYQVFKAATDALQSLDAGRDQELERDRLRVLAYGWLRRANVLRQWGRVDEAAECDDAGLAAARDVGDSVVLGRAILSVAGTRFANGEPEEGLRLLDEADRTFSESSTNDAVQGLGWCQILRADVANAGLADIPLGDVVAVCDRALDLLTPIDNWPGVARANTAKAIALKRSGDLGAADRASRAAAVAEDMVV